MKYTFKILSILFAFCIMLSCKKTTKDNTEAKIDEIFSQWNKANSPGAAVAVIKDGKVIFKKGYGMANLEYDVPITPSSIFHIASESKQFTAFCIVLLAKEGKLSLDDDIRKHLPYIPDFGKKITIRNLIHHTSGLRDQWQILSIGGQAIDDVIKQEHIIKLVSNQKDLNFEPGSRMLYCNTGYTLLAEIVKKVSGKSLRQYADEKIFKPLNMNNTHFHDDNTEIVKGRTYSYDFIAVGKYANNPLNYATVGATSLFTTVEDDAKWLVNYETAKVGGKDAISQMYEQAVLSNGKQITYAFGIEIDTYNGYKRIGHGGSDAGYRTYTVRFPEEKLGIVVFSNLGQVNPIDLSMKVAELYLPKQAVDNKPTTSTKTDKSLFKFYKGLYTSSESSVKIIDSTNLYLSFGSVPYELMPLTDSSFSVFDGLVKIIFPKSNMTSINSLKLITPEDEKTFHRYEKLELTNEVLAQFAGRYVNDELATEYDIVMEKDSLVLRHRKYPDVHLNAITVNQFSIPHWWMSNILFNRNEKGEVKGFEINCDRVLHLKFRKTN
jgi:CubicO group peptidase (beta-lactamase class C family)